MSIPFARAHSAATCGMIQDGPGTCCPTWTVWPFSYNPGILSWQRPGPQPFLARLLVNGWVTPGR